MRSKRVHLLDTIFSDSVHVHTVGGDDPVEPCEQLMHPLAVGRRGRLAIHKENICHSHLHVFFAEKVFFWERAVDVLTNGFADLQVFEMFLPRVLPGIKEFRSLAYYHDTQRTLLFKASGLLSDKSCALWLLLIFSAGSSMYVRRRLL